MEKPWKELHIGYLPKGVAAVFASKMDAASISVEEAWLMEVDPEEGSGQLLLKVRKLQREIRITKREIRT